jgi:hypothetical protein
MSTIRVEELMVDPGCNCLACQQILHLQDPQSAIRVVNNWQTQTGKPVPMIFFGKAVQ